MLPVPLFRLRPLLGLDGGASVRLVAARQTGADTVLALLLDSGALMLVLLRPRRRPVVRQVDLPAETDKRVAAMCLCPTGDWLLVAVSAGALFVLPAGCALRGTRPSPGGRLRADDATAYPPAAHPPQPTAVAWWRHGSADLAVIGGRQGEIEFVDLASGERVGGTYVRRGIARLDVVREDIEGRVYLLISSAGGGEQWRLLLEHQVAGYIVPLDALQAAPSSESTDSPGELVRNKLNSLRQLSREKLGSLQQRWADSRLFRRSVARDETGACGTASGSDSASTGSGSMPIVTVEPDTPRTPKPESLTGLVGETRVALHSLRSGDVLAGYYEPTGTLSVHMADLESVPLSIHKMPPSVGRLLVTDAVIFVTDVDGARLFLISSNFSQCDMDMRRFNEDCVLSVFDLEPADGLLALLPTAESAPPARPRLRPHLETLKPTPMRGCLVVTRRGLAICEPLTTPEAALLELGTSAGAGAHLLERVHKLFNVPVGRLFETLGDLKLEEREFTLALAYYRLTKKPHMAVVHKFAAFGYSSQLLHYATILLSGVSEGLLLSDRRRLSDMALLAHCEMSLRSGSANDDAALAKFLRTNRHYDAGLALQYTMLARQWDCVRYLLAERRQQQRLLACLTSPEPAPAPPGDDVLDHEVAHDPGLRAVLLARPRLAGLYVMKVCERVPRLPAAVLRRLAAITDPLSAELRPLTHGLLGHQPSRRTLSTSQPPSRTTLTNGGSQELCPLEPDDLVDLHLHVLLHLVRAAGPGRAAVLPAQAESPCRAVGAAADWPPTLSAGFSHAALSRRGELIVWGENSSQCLGDPELSAELATPRAVEHLSAVGVAVIQVACGRAHTVALTTGGVYAWGAGRYGQLGLGAPGSCPHPRLLQTLAYRRVVRVAAGQYHSLALTDDGRLWAWGWNVFGQCGRSSVEDVLWPRPVPGMSKRRVSAVAAGYAHSAALTDDGKVFVFGCNAYGQLGDGSTRKSCRVTQVELPEPAVHLACGFFCCVAVLRSGRVFRWGLDPQSVRLGAQAQKKKSQAAAAAAAAAATTNGVSNGPVSTPARPVGPEARSSQKTVDLLRDAAPGEATPPAPFTPETRDHLSPSEVDTSDVDGRVVSVAGGAQHTLYLSSSGRLYAQGRNLDGQLGVGGRQEAPRLSEVTVPGGAQTVAVACGADFTLLLTDDGAVLGCGSNSYGQLGQLPAADKLDDAKLVLLKNRRLLRLPQGQNSSETPQPVVATDSGRRTPLEVVFSLTERHECAFSRPAEFSGDAERLHAIIGLFQGSYDSAQLLGQVTTWRPIRAEAAAEPANGGGGEALLGAVTAVAAEYLALPVDGSVAGSVQLRQLLLELVAFWLDCQLPVPRLEQLLEPQLERLAHPLAVLAVSAGSADMQLSDSRISALFSRLSAGFCLVAFSCGHSLQHLPALRDDALPELRVGLSSLGRPIPRTAALLMAQYRQLDGCRSACPSCVLRYVQRCVDTTSEEEDEML
ncbi:X-linked retinitis pigmentosa GTPase regulator [Amphibalanus amphitrite]|uniref:X-linked retinitis pigmentosa GTPase regulator n=1 Tax=Amphibalanus amphitrite TaxID=1232801 RepID=A0A6A4X3C0_AMPAM|nr:X-linked retinitis pigmentosa GTPase regulator [Amphibalanus amphitrite]